MRTAILAALLVLTACTPFHDGSWSPGQPGLHLVREVPFRAQQQRDDCGPAALASLLAHRGDTIAVAEIASQTYSPALGGTLLPDLENFARRRGFATRSGRGDLDLLRTQVDAGRPVLIPVETGYWEISRPHYLVVFGYDRDRFLVHAGERPAVFIAAAELQRRWEKLNRLYLWLE